MCVSGGRDSESNNLRESYNLQRTGSCFMFGSNRPNKKKEILKCHVTNSPVLRRKI